MNGKKYIEALSIVEKKLKKDPHLRESWRATIAMSFMDTYRSKKKKKPLSDRDVVIIANEGAELFLKILCDEIKIPAGR